MEGTEAAAEQEEAAAEMVVRVEEKDPCFNMTECKHEEIHNGSPNCNAVTARKQFIQALEIKINPDCKRRTNI